MTGRDRFALAIGGVMIALGAYVALHPLWSRERVTGQWWLDLAFAFFFLLRGTMYVRGVLRRR